MKPYYDEGGITIYHADCREILPTLPPCDLALTDPPYANGTEYASFDDSRASVSFLIAETMPLIRKASRVALTCGVANIWLYPPSDWILAWVVAAGAGSGPWGFCCWQPILVYGADPYLASGKGRRPDIIERNERSELNGHPCPKPIGTWKRVLLRCQPEDTGTIIDPFLGSGTTLQAAKDLGRRAIGIEIEERYCEIAAKRLAQSVMQFGKGI